MEQVIDQDLFTIEGVNILSSDGWTGRKSVVVKNGVIEEIIECGSSFGRTITAEGLSLMPGIIDIHGDGFEYHLAPRAGVSYPIDMAMMANDMGLIASGITTFYYSLTDGFEPGMRSRQTVRDILDVLEKHRASMKSGVRIHIRHEQANTHDHDELVSWIKDGRIDLLSLNNHLPAPDNNRAFERYLTGFKRRVSSDTETAMQMIKDYQHRLPEGLEQFKELSALSLEHGVILASHDDMDDSEVDLSLERGVNVAEFPMTMALSKRFRDNNVHVLMGAPNAVRGGSHVNAVSARDAIAEGVVDVLCSDYHYPSLFRAPFLLHEIGLLDMPQAWDLVSANAAHAAGLHDKKGRIAPGMDADMILVSGLSGFSSDLKAVIREGRFVMASEML